MFGLMTSMTIVELAGDSRVALNEPCDGQKAKTGVRHSLDSQVIQVLEPPCNMKLYQRGVPRMSTSSAISHHLSGSCMSDYKWSASR